MIKKPIFKLNNILNLFFWSKMRQRIPDSRRLSTISPSSQKAQFTLKQETELLDTDGVYSVYSCRFVSNWITGRRRTTHGSIQGRVVQYLDIFIVNLYFYSYPSYISFLVRVWWSQMQDHSDWYVTMGRTLLTLFLGGKRVGNRICHQSIIVTQEMLCMVNTS